MMKSVLIANRGEIACRIIHTCRSMGLRTIAVYSDADRDALHVQLADEAVHIGPPQPSESYLKIENILRAVEVAGADAVHPGYGFLSENTKFARALADAGITFIGPNAEAIRQMGDKIESKRIAEKAGVPGVPGYNGDDQTDAVLIAEAEKIGFPLMVKASAGGGGKGMRRVFERKELEGAIDMARKEAKSSFGDDRLLIEKLITRPRHLEVQIAADKHGNVIHLFERDCSVQRNNQKVLEEAPAPNLPDGVRNKLFERAIALAKTIGYDSLGTVEFIMDAGDDEPAFLEMNTRLQVEHPVTEYITGLDLVELQIRIAGGEELPYEQHEIYPRGHAIEARVTAEKPAQNFMPDIGKVHLIHWPTDIRIDTGIEAGSEISQYYDSMVAKIIAYGSERREACDRLAAALETTAVIGVETNTAFLRDCVLAEDFYAGRATTSFLPETFPDGWQPDASSDAIMAMRAAAIWQAIEEQHQPFTGFRVLSNAGNPARSFVTIQQEGVEPDGGEAVEMIVSRSCADGTPGKGGTRYAISGGGETHEVGVKLDGSMAMLFGEGYRTAVSFFKLDEVLYIGAKGRVRKFTILPSAEFARARLAAGGSGDVVSDMPGAVSEVLVEAGQPIEAGQPVLVLESMKLLITLNASVSGTVETVAVKPGDIVKAGAVLVGITPQENG
ncbi:acetyl/propionyl/methylcrotonyl-CoA carboxylase subunit alpha [Aquisalinus flavus]|uniref:Acetyl/propionyl-CoA carboxylase subuit alpha n=1 Tax=Aquisalinus flavus TaxID=1526572 RepID=A0A8J2V1E9_9PROT|nr:biotin carboxylase N-terminal domain-containing protein [Aquisalinus flavus]MBD0427003.1 biotin/lipoyl-binding protein [Aquisalinus flavus]GGC97593.1 acetyl/propionyl-CoA carboxylase subuit alpha [Aquisalinus flavus]